jgi:hypothetical protein
MTLTTRKAAYSATVTTSATQQFSQSELDNDRRSGTRQARIVTLYTSGIYNNIAERSKGCWIDVTVPGSSQPRHIDAELNKSSYIQS